MATAAKDARLIVRAGEKNGVRLDVAAASAARLDRAGLAPDSTKEQSVATCLVEGFAAVEDGVDADNGQGTRHGFGGCGPPTLMAGLPRRGKILSLTQYE